MLEYDRGFWEDPGKNTEEKERGRRGREARVVPGLTKGCWKAGFGRRLGWAGPKSGDGVSAAEAVRLETEGKVKLLPVLEAGAEALLEAWAPEPPPTDAGL